MRYDVRHRLLTLAILCLMVSSTAAALRPEPPATDQGLDAATSSADSWSEAPLAIDQSWDATGRVASPDPEATQRASEALETAPMAFERNVGQTDRRVKYLARGAGYTLFLTGRDTVLTLKRGGSERLDPLAVRGEGAVTSEARSGTRAIVRLRHEGAAGKARVVGEELLEGRVNYMLGEDRAEWHTDVPTYARVRYEGVYPGIDVVYYGRQGRMEYDYVVKPGADPALISTVFEGADEVTVNESGDVVLRIGDQELIQRRPVVYQERSDGTRQEVSGAYTKLGSTRVGYRFADYDGALALVVDPVLEYSTYLGGAMRAGTSDGGQKIAIDNQGYAYVTGYTDSLNFPTTTTRYQENSLGSDAFVAKIDPSGSGAASLLFSTYLGGTSSDIGNDIAVDASGNAYVTGYTDSINFPISPSCYQGNKGGRDAFVAKINTRGSGEAALLYSTYLGGSGVSDASDIGQGIAVDASGYVYVTGNTDSTDFPTTASGFQGDQELTDAFVAKINTGGSGDASLLYSTYLGGSDAEVGRGIAVVGSGNVCVTGYTKSTNFPTTASRYQGDQPYQDAFVVKVNTGGSGAASLLYSTYLGGSDVDYGVALAVDASGNAYVTGFTSSTNFPTTALCYQGDQASSDAFVAKVNTGGSGAASLLYSTYLGGDNIDQAYSIAVDTSGNAYVAGTTDSTDFPTTASCYQGDQASSDAFVAKVNTGGSGAASLLYSTYLGGDNIDQAYSIAVDTSGNAYVAGTTDSTDFPTTASCYQGDISSISDAFVTKINTGGTGAASLLYSTYLGGDPGSNDGYAVAVGGGKVYVAGVTDALDFPTTASVAQGNIAGDVDGFVYAMTADGTARVYSTYIGGSDDDFATGIAVDSLGKAYLTGYTDSVNFPTVNTSRYQGNQTAIDVFVTKLDPSGSSLLYSTYLGGWENEYGQAIAVDNVGNAYVTGYTHSYPTGGQTWFPLNAYDTRVDNSSYDAFISKINTDATSGNASLVWSTALGRRGDDYGMGIAVDGSGYVYVTGYTLSAEFPITDSSRYQAWPADEKYNAFVTKFDTTQVSSAALLYSTYLGGGDNDFGRGIAVDTAGNAYVTGFTYSTNFPTTASRYQTDQAGRDAFVSLIDTVHHPGTASLVGSTYLGGGGDDGCTAIVVDPLSGIVCVTGWTDSGDFPVTASPVQTDQPGRDAFVSKVNLWGHGIESLVFSTYLGGSNDDVGQAVAIDASGAAYITGYTTSLDFPIANPYQGTLKGAQSAFVLKLNTNCSYSISPSSASFGGAGSGSVSVTATSACAWTAISNATWITVTSGSSGSGNGTVGYSVAANTTGTTRTGTMTIAYQTFTVTQSSCVDVLQFSAPTYTVAEGTANATITVSRTTSCGGTVSVNYATSNNTATAGSDYTAKSGTLTFTPTDASKTFTVPITNDTAVEGNETLNIALSAPSAGVTLGQNAKAVLTITDNDPVGAFQFSAITYTVVESVSAQSVTITVARVNGTTGAATVDFAAASNTATAGSDFTLPPGTLTFGNGTASKTFTIQITDDALVEGNESLHLVLSNPTGGATIGARNRAMVTIADNDAAATGFTLNATSYTANEGSPVTVTIKRSITTTAQDVILATSNNGTAVAGTDYTAYAQPVSFAVGQASRTVQITTTADALAEGIESVNLTLSNPTNGGTLGAQRTAVVVIDDNKGTLQFSAGTYTVGEASATVTITASRVDGATGSVTVQYATSDNTAAAGSDYTAASGTLTFGAGVASKTFAIPITNDALAEGVESINLALSNPTGGAVLGNARRAVVIVTDDETP